MVDKQLEKFERWIREMFENRQKSEVCYHNMDHSLQIVKKVAEIGEYYNLSKEEKEDLYVAGWMHDIGYWEGKGEGHEIKGSEMAQKYLIELGLNQERVDRIKSLILATKVPQNPKNLLEEIICDADLFHLSSERFFEQTLLLKKEKTNLGFEKTSLSEWLKDSRLFMLAHHYHTEYAKIYFQPGKEANLESIEMKIKEAEEHSKAKSEGKKKDKNKKKSERGIETMFRITSKNHLALSALADNKANIMISVNSIIISIVVAVFIRIIEEFPYYLVPTLMLITTCLIAMVFAILATRPNVTNGIVTKEDIRKKKGNLLYFGNFYEMPLPEYKEGMHALMDDGTYLYDSMITDIYYLGIVLSKKYFLLRKCYNIFMFGFVLSVISFLIATYIFEPIPR
ncbi:Pycsar system effector family protein [Cyclobacterium amurskyense]|uniref:Metal-dependent phosphohydrolase HD sub domain-containing protein n=1 Tax=Cyclobacterium amurskyense TaxID=320787 RepID=A0A0H4PCA2_9BACT|nr:Pycsar system effector family protein [Cyclobacterium amurskyense]AKP50760.1 Metal-dependent phosphohydrolase HD sub domain-containing protein [Cyclobacterium amurskyense]